MVEFIIIIIFYYRFKDKLFLTNEISFKSQVTFFHCETEIYLENSGL